MKTIRTLLLCTSLLAGTVAAQESSLVLSNGLGFVDTPYKAGTLEVDDTEDLIINCDEVDCTTFVAVSYTHLTLPTSDLVHEYASGTLQIVEKFSGERSPNGKV